MTKRISYPCKYNENNKEYEVINGETLKVGDTIFYYYDTDEYKKGIIIQIIYNYKIKPISLNLPLNFGFQKCGDFFENTEPLIRQLEVESEINYNVNDVIPDGYDLLQKSRFIVSYQKRYVDGIVEEILKTNYIIKQIEE